MIISGSSYKVTREKLANVSIRKVFLLDMSVSRKDFSTLLLKVYKCGCQHHRDLNKKSRLLLYLLVFYMISLLSQIIQIFIIAPVFDQSIEEPVAQVHKMEKKIWISKWFLYRLPINLPILGTTLHSNLQRYMVPDVLMLCGFCRVQQLVPYWRNGF